MINLQVKPRAVGESLENMREDGFMPAVFYGKKQESTPVSVAMADFLKVWKQAGESAVVTLKNEGSEDIEALIHDVDLDPISEMPRHADFYVFEKGHKIEIDVPLEFIGVSIAVKDLGGILIKVLHNVKIEAMPKDLPQKIEVDISSLSTLDSQLIAADLHMPEGVTLIEGAEEVVALITVPKEEVEETETAVDLSAIEVEKKGKKEEEGEPGAEGGESAEK